MRRASVLVMAAVLVAGCAELSQFLRAAFKEPSLTFQRMGLENISLSGLTLDTTWALNNPNAIGISLASVDYALFVDDKQVVVGSPAQGLQIAANASTDLHFPAAIRFQDLVAVVETFLNKDTAAYRAEGSLGVQTPIGVLKFPIAKSGDFEVPKIPAIAFANPRISNLSLQGVTIEFPLTVTNKNSYSLPVTGVVGNLNLAGSNLGSISTGDLGALDGKGVRTIALPLTVNFMSAGMGIFNAVQRGNAPVTFDAKLKSGTTEVPLNLNQLVNFVR